MLCRVENKRNTDLDKNNVATSGSNDVWLVADIGGTNARFALMSEDGKLLGETGYFRCADYAAPEDAAAEFLRRAGNLRPSVAAFALAAPVNANDISSPVSITNNSWVFTRERINAALGLAHLLLINDFEALALALPALTPEQYQLFAGPALAQVRAPKAVIGPGTGLGVAGLVPVGLGWVAVPGEGGHATLAAADDFEANVLRVARGEFGHVSAERLLSGIGMPTLYQAVAQVLGERRETLAPEQIVKLAQDNDAVAAKTIHLFCAMLGGFAGSVALTFGARGGVYIAGGIVPKLGGLFDAALFRERFEAKGRFREYLAAIPTPLLVAPDIALTGAGQAIRHFWEK